jgi:putative phosphoesterase
VSFHDGLPSRNAEAFTFPDRLVSFNDGLSSRNAEAPSRNARPSSRNAETFLFRDRPVSGLLHRSIRNVGRDIKLASFLEKDAEVLEAKTLPAISPCHRATRLAGGSKNLGVTPLEKSARVAVRADGSLRLAVVADTHSAPHPATASLLRSLAPDAILHAGDIGDLSVLDDLAAIAPVFAIRGNIDVHAPELPDALVLDVVSGDATLLRILLLHIAVAGPKLRADAARLARAREASLVVCGHSHVPLVARDRDLAVFNPGSVGPRRFRLPIALGTIDLTPSDVRLAHYDCETGLPWKPS